MKSLVSGGAGFIGSNLIKRLLDEGKSVVCIDNFFIGNPKNISSFLSRSNFKFYEEDLTNFEAISKIFEREEFDEVYHMAANSDIQASAKDPSIEYKNTYTTTFCVLECMRLHGVKKFFFCSTSAVYGDSRGEKVNEQYSPLLPISYYGACKLGCEALISAYSFMNSFKSLIFRFPNVIGPNLTHGVIFDFMKRLQKDPERLVILGDGNQKKPYLHVRDLVDCIISVFSDIPEGVSTFNVGVDTQSTVRDIANIVCKELGLCEVAFSYTGGRGGWKGDVPVFAYDLTKIHGRGWFASMSSDEAVSQTVKEEIARCKR